MIRNTANAVASQERRLRTKTQDRRLANLAVQGAGISPWEAAVLVDMVKEVYFSNPENRPVSSGQLRYDCVAATEGAGKPIEACQMVTVVLTLFDRDDGRLQPQDGKQELRERRIMRLTEEAREQGGLLSQEDLAQLLFCDVRTIRRDIRRLREQQGIHVATRGQQKDIGPGVSHRGVALRLWVEGKEPMDVARRINHSLAAVERYIQHFSRVVFLARKGFHPLQIALTVGISSAGVATYLDIYQTYKPQVYQRRYKEIDLIGETHYEAEDEKKGGPLHGGNGNNEWRRP